MHGSKLPPHVFPFTPLNLKRELESVESFEFIFTSPSFMPDEMTDAAKKEAMQRHVNGIGHGGRCTGLLPTHSSVGCSGVVLTSVALHRHRSPTSPLSTKNSRIHHDRQLMNTGLHALERTLTGQGRNEKTRRLALRGFLVLAVP